MITIFIYIALALFGLILGSFAGATVWRIRSRANHDVYDKSETGKLKKLSKRKLLKDRSCCLNCSYTLQWYDMIPVISWLFLRGKCRKCHKPIGWMEILIEIFMAAFFVASYAFWPYTLSNWLQITRLVLWLVAGVGLAILFVYDYKWGRLPTFVNKFVIFVGVLNAIIVIISSSNKYDATLSILAAAAILSGIYWLLYKISNGKWIGDGDIPLGFALALLLADWKLAYLALMMANLIGCLIVLPIMAYQKLFPQKNGQNSKLNLSSRVPFGPLFIVGFVIAGLAGNFIINLYISSL